MRSASISICRFSKSRTWQSKGKSQPNVRVLATHTVMFTRLPLIRGPSCLFCDSYAIPRSRQSWVPKGRAYFSLLIPPI
jgi:hypothetical protein